MNSIALLSMLAVIAVLASIICSFCWFFGKSIRRLTPPWFRRTYDRILEVRVFVPASSPVPIPVTTISERVEVEEKRKNWTHSGVQPGAQLEEVVVHGSQNNSTRGERHPKGYDRKPDGDHNCCDGAGKGYEERARMMLGPTMPRMDLSGTFIPPAGVRTSPNY